MSDLTKFAVIGAIMGALLLAGLLLQPATIEEETIPVTPIATTTEVTVLKTTSLEMLDPIYSEKAVYQDRTIRVSFDASQDADGIESRLPFWLHNTSGGVINVLWDRCSIQLPEGNTVGVLSEEGMKYGTGSALSIAPAGDLFDALIPMSEMTWTENGYEVSHGVLDQGIFTVVLAIERDKALAVMTMAPCAEPTLASPAEVCGQPMTVESMPMPMMMSAMDCGNGREIVYYALRFIIR